MPAATISVVLAVPAALSWKRWVNRQRTPVDQRPPTDSRPLRSYQAVISIAFALGAATMTYGFMAAPLGIGWLAWTLFLTVRFVLR